MKNFLKLIDGVFKVPNARYRKYFYLEREDARVCYIEERDIPFSQINFRYNYLDEDVVIYSKFSDNTEIKIVFPIEDRPYACFMMDGQNIYEKKTLLSNFKFSLGIIPPVGTFEESESLGDKEYVSSIFVSHLTARHFRNIWHFYEEGFEDFKALIEKTWPDYTIQPPEFNLMDNRVHMFFKENSITREIFWAGHGFQIWLQLMTFLVKLGRMDTLILDEPDIYLHSDMQKKLVNICKERSNQVIIATHAVDIIEEVDPEEIDTVG